MCKKSFLPTPLNFLLAVCWITFSSVKLIFPQSVEDIRDKEFQAIKTQSDCEQFIMKYKPDNLAFVAVQLLAKSYLNRNEWIEASNLYQKYQIFFPNLAERFTKTIELLNRPAPAKALTKINLGDSINSKLYDEYTPIISADGRQLYFCRIVSDIIFKDGKLKVIKNEDVLVSFFNGKEWSRAKNLGAPICTYSHEAPLGISADGTVLLLFGNYSGGIGKGDNFYSEKTDSGWSAVKPFPMPINSDYYDSDAMLTADGKAILFCSDRPGGIGNFHQKDKFSDGEYWGNTDIYVCLKTDSGWSKAINLGPIINTPNSERMPFLHPDGKTLYFSSSGHPGLGQLDVFISTRQSDTSWTKWSEPVNIGKEVNGAENDWGFRITTAGDKAYFAASNLSPEDSTSEIYVIELPPGPWNKMVTTVSGLVTDPEHQPMDAQLKWNDLTLNKPVGEARSDPQTGKYFIALPAGHKYSYHAEKSGYVSQAEYLDLTDKSQFTEYTLNIILYPIKKIDIPLKLVIFFDIDKFELLPDSFLELDRWVKILNENPNLRLEIHGHTDDTGTIEHNQILSQRRAEAVMNYLINHDVIRQRMWAKGFGKQRQIAANDTEDGRQQNRRVEIKFLELAQK
jgi:outer membrane protein OmpA-like peptidoglycan-associated protein